MIEVANARKRYGTFEAVRDITFEIGNGEVVGLLGPNGAGKTTVMKMLTCYHYPTSGSIHINGNNIFQQQVAIKRDIGYLPENAPVYTDLTVWEYLQFVAQARGIPAAERPAKIEHTIARCGLESVRHSSIDVLSKGYKQRVGLAQAIIHNPPILILDEPTNGLDPNQIIEIRSLIRNLGEEKTVILSSHILQEVEAVCDRVIILNEGKIAAMGTAAEIAAGMRGGEMYRVTLKGSESTDFQTLFDQLKTLENIVNTKERSNTDTRRDIWRGELILRPEIEGTGGELIFDWAVARNLKILELAKPRVKLEDLFTQLTQGEESE